MLSLFIIWSTLIFCYRLTRWGKWVEIESPGAVQGTYCRVGTRINKIILIETVSGREGLEIALGSVLPDIDLVQGPEIVLEIDHATDLVRETGRIESITVDVDTGI